MKPKINVLSLPVDDLERLLAFYRDGLGLPASDIEEGCSQLDWKAVCGYS